MIGSQHQTANWTLGISRATVAIPASASTERACFLVYSRESLRAGAGARQRASEERLRA